MTIPFVALSLFTYLLSEQAAYAPTLQLGVAMGFVAFAAGVAFGKPDAEVLAWVILGTALLASEAEYPGAGIWIPAATAVAIVLMADIGHSVAILYSRDRSTAVDEAQEASRRRLLLRRVGTMGTAAAASMALALIGGSLAAPFVLAGFPAATVAGFAVVALALLVAAVMFNRQV